MALVNPDVALMHERADRHTPSINFASLQPLQAVADILFGEWICARTFVGSDIHVHDIKLFPVEVASRLYL